MDTSPRNVARPSVRSRLTSGLLATALLAAVMGAAAPATAHPARVVPGGTTTTLQRAIDLDVYQARVLRLVNERRTAHHLHAVRTISPCVDRLSERWATHLAETGDFVHRDQQVVLDRCNMHWAGETLARGTAMAPAAAVRAWMHSSEHRAVLLKGRANRAGLGVRIDLHGRVVLVLNFADTRG